MSDTNHSVAEAVRDGLLEALQTEEINVAVPPVVESEDSKDNCSADVNNDSLNLEDHVDAKEEATEGLSAVSAAEIDFETLQETNIDMTMFTNSLEDGIDNDVAQVGVLAKDVTIVHSGPSDNYEIVVLESDVESPVPAPTVRKTLLSFIQGLRRGAGKRVVESEATGVAPEVMDSADIAETEVKEAAIDVIDGNSGDQLILIAEKDQLKSSGRRGVYRILHALVFNGRFNRIRKEREETEASPTRIRLRAIATSVRNIFRKKSVPENQESDGTSAIAVKGTDDVKVSDDDVRKEVLELAYNVNELQSDEVPEAQVPEANLLD